LGTVPQSKRGKVVQNLGKRLRALRNEQGLTLVQLGQQVSLSASYLSQIERGETTPSLSRLTTIAKALDVEVRYFFEEDVSAPCIIRLNQGKRLSGTANAIMELLSADLTDKKIQPYRLVCQPGASRDQPPTHPGEELGFVLKGQLTVTVGEETFVLKAGDSIHYETLQPHSWRNEGDEECIAIWAVSPPIPGAELEG
jgi:transcriptional regulator with XRE-family HTH domain